LHLDQIFAFAKRDHCHNWRKHNFSAVWEPSRISNGAEGKVQESVCVVHCTFCALVLHIFCEETSAPIVWRNPDVEFETCVVFLAHEWTHNAISCFFLWAQPETAWQITTMENMLKFTQHLHFPGYCRRDSSDFRS